MCREDTNFSMKTNTHQLAAHSVQWYREVMAQFWGIDFGTCVPWLGAKRLLMALLGNNMNPRPAQNEPKHEGFWFRLSRATAILPVESASQTSPTPHSIPYHNQKKNPGC